MGAASEHSGDCQQEGDSDVRNRALMVFGFASGLRRGELAAVRVGRR